MKTTIQVAEELNTTQRTILVTLTKHPHLRPQQRIGYNLIWTDLEIDAYRNRERHKAGRKPKRSSD